MEPDRWSLCTSSKDQSDLTRLSKVKIGRGLCGRVSDGRGWSGLVCFRSARRARLSLFKIWHDNVIIEREQRGQDAKDAKTGNK